MTSFKQWMVRITVVMGFTAWLLGSGLYAYGRPHDLSSAAAELQNMLQSEDATVPGKSFGHALHEMLKLLLAAALGLVIAIVHKRTMKVRAINVSLEQAEILLCVAGALMVIIIGNSLARAFGLVGAASFIRFRTPVKDPKDTVVLFLLVGIGMSCGLGIYAIAVLGTVVLVIFLGLLHKFGSQEDNERLLLLEVIASEYNRTHARIQKILSAHHVQHELVKIKWNEDATFQYEVSLTLDQSIEEFNQQIRAGDAGVIKSICWEARKKS